MAKLKFKLSPAGILFLIATLVLIIALVSVIIVLGKSCKSNDTNRETAAESSALPASSTDCSGAICTQTLLSLSFAFKKKSFKPLFFVTSW